MKQNNYSIDPRLIGIENFFISDNNNNNRQGSIYANGVMQAIVYIHYAYNGETAPNTEVEQYIKENIAFYNKGENPESVSPGKSKPFNIVDGSDEYIHDLEYDTSQSNELDENEFVTKVYITVSEGNEATYVNFQPYVEKAYNNNLEYVLSLSAKKYFVSKSEVVLTQEERKTYDDEDGISDLWSVQYKNMPSQVKLRSLIDFERNRDNLREVAVYESSSGTYLKGILGINCLVLFSGTGDRKMVLGYTPEYYKIEGSPEPNFGSSRDAYVEVYSTYFNQENHSEHLDTGKYTSGYPSDYSDKIQDRFSAGKIYMFAIKANYGPRIFHIDSNTGFDWTESYNNLSDKCFYMISDNAGNIVQVKFDFSNKWEKHRDDYISIIKVDQQ